MICAECYKLRKLLKGMRVWLFMVLERADKVNAKSKGGNS